ncbi:MAG TPA: ice-binding family protein [Chthoniobacterales bacterium]|nr:ice-binding family protein [Chthoniobacterales bacterium]
MFQPKQFLFAAAAFATLTIGSVTAHADLLTSVPTIGDLFRWRVFALGGDVVVDNVDTTGNTYIQGDVGVAGAGNVRATGNVLVDGNLWYRSNGTLTVTGNARLNGSIFHAPAYDPQLDNGVAEANNASNQAWALPVTPAYAGITNINLSGKQNLTLSGAPGQTVVLKLNDFKISSGTLTLQGTATTNFVLNVTKSFSLTNHAQIILSGGVVAQNVLFNVRGTGTDVTMSGESVLRGYILANQRTVSNSGKSIVRGGIWANQVKLSGGAQVVSP